MSYKQLRNKLLERPVAREAHDRQLAQIRIGRMLSRSRKFSNRSLEEIANDVGLSESELRKLEAGLIESEPTFVTLVRIAQSQRMKLVIELVPQDASELLIEGQAGIREVF